MADIPRILRWTETALALSWLALTGSGTWFLVIGLDRTPTSPVAMVLGSLFLALSIFVGITAVRLVDHLRGAGNAEERFRTPIYWVTLPVLVAAVIFSSGWWRLWMILALVMQLVDVRQRWARGRHATGA